MLPIARIGKLPMRVKQAGASGGMERGKAFYERARGAAAFADVPGDLREWLEGNLCLIVDAGWIIPAGIFLQISFPF